MQMTAPQHVALWFRAQRRLFRPWWGWWGLFGVAAIEACGVVPWLWMSMRHVCAVGCFVTVSEQRSMMHGPLSASLYAALQVALQLLFSFVCYAVGAVILAHSRQQQRPGFARYTAVMLLGFGLAGPLELLLAYPAGYHGIWLWIAVTANFFSQTLLFLFLFLFPDGHFAPRWFVIPIVALILIALGISVEGCLKGLLGEALAQQNTVRSDGVLVVCLTSLAIVSQILKFRRAKPSGVERQQTKWVLVGIIVLSATGIFEYIVLNFWPPGPAENIVLLTIETLAALGLPLSIGFAVLRYRLWDVNVVLSRTLVYLGLSGSIVGLYVIVVGGLGTFWQLRGNPLLTLLAFGIGAVFFQSVRARLQAEVNRLLYGERDDPYALVARLGQRIEATFDAQTTLTQIVETVATALKLPYVALSVREGEQHVTTTAFGTPGAALIGIPLVHSSEHIGELVVAPRPATERLTPRDLRLLTDLARQISVAVHARQLQMDLQCSRERLVLAREEERRRLRRDLHDDIGPTLASLVQRLDAASRLVETEPATAVEMLGAIKRQVRGTIGNIRRVVYELRPPVLDELGLVAAIRDEIIPAHSESGVTITFHAPETLPPLSAATEVAALRIVQEALMNVVRHAQAKAAWVTVTMCETGQLSIKVADDGQGISTGHHIGVGLTSIRERAAELGGKVDIGPRPEGGTRVHVWLPLLFTPPEEAN